MKIQKNNDIKFFQASSCFQRKSMFCLTMCSPTSSSPGLDECDGNDDRPGTRETNRRSRSQAPQRWTEKKGGSGSI